MSRNSLFPTATFLGVVALLLVPQACKTSHEDITVGWIGPLTGDAAPYGQAIKKGTDLAISEINSGGGVLGKKLRVVYEDDQALARVGTAAFQKLLTVDKPPVIVQAAASSVMLANIPVAEENKIVYISPSCSSDKIREEKIRLNAKYIFRTWPSDSYQGRLLAGLAYRQLHAKRAAVIYINNDYGVGLKQIVKEIFNELGGQVVADEGFAQGASDFRAQLAKVRATNPDVVFLASHYQEAAQLLRQAKELGIKSQFISDAALFSPELLKVGGDAAEGLIVTNPRWSPDSQEPNVKAFVSAFRQSYKETPDVYAAAGYDCAKVIADAMTRGGLSSEQIRNALASVEGFRGVTGQITFDDNGEVQAQYDVYVVRGGQFVLRSE